MLDGTTVPAALVQSARATSSHGDIHPQHTPSLANLEQHQLSLLVESDKTSTIRSAPIATRQPSQQPSQSAVIMDNSSSTSPSFKNIHIQQHDLLLHGYSQQFHLGDSGSQQQYESNNKNQSIHTGKHKGQCKECTLHHCERVAMICVDCKEQLCVCCVDMHCGHIVQSGIVDCTESSKQLVKRSLHDLNNEIEGLLLRHDELTSTRNEVIEVIQQHIHEVNRFSRRIIETVQINADTLIQKAKEFARSNYEIIEKALSRTRALLADLIDSYKSIEGAMEKSEEQVGSEKYDCCFGFEDYLELARTAGSTVHAKKGVGSPDDRWHFFTTERLCLDEHAIVQSVEREIEGKTREAYNHSHRLMSGRRSRIYSDIKKHSSMFTSPSKVRGMVEPLQSLQQSVSKLQQVSKVSLQHESPSTNTSGIKMDSRDALFRKAGSLGRKLRSPGESSSYQFCGDSTDFSQSDETNNHLKLNSNNNMALHGHNNSRNQSESRNLLSLKQQFSLQESSRKSSLEQVQRATLTASPLMMRQFTQQIKAKRENQLTSGNGLVLLTPSHKQTISSKQSQKTPIGNMTSPERLSSRLRRLLEERKSNELLMPFIGRGVHSNQQMASSVTTQGGNPSHQLKGFLEYMHRKTMKPRKNNDGMS